MFIRVMRGLSEWHMSNVIARVHLFFARSNPDLTGDCFDGRTLSRKDIVEEEKWRLKI
jgi:hypothetical protein